MFRAFRSMQQVHELLLLLREAGRIRLPPAYARRRLELLERLEPAAGWTAESLILADLESCDREVHAFLRTLRDCI
jgi:hypothetical protein